MAISRAVSLCEVFFARMAASTINDADRWVFPKGSSWPRDWERKFYKTTLTTPFIVDGDGFGALRDLRDLYVHGYGVPALESRRQTLARRLYSQMDTSPRTSAEEMLGYEDKVYFFGDRSRFSAATRTLEGVDAFATRQADVSPLAAYRLLESMRAHAHAAHAAILGGFRLNLDATTCAFVKTASTWWTKQDITTASEQSEDSLRS